MAIRIVRLGSSRVRGEGTRIGTVRRPPRGVPRTEFASRGYYDVWFPILAPSAALLQQGRAAATDAEWREFRARYVAEMRAAPAKHALALLATLSHEASFSVGCYCEDEARCHRSILRELLLEEGADVV